MTVWVGGLATARRTGLSRWRRFGLILLFSLTSTDTCALDPSRQIFQHVRSAWTVKEGFLPEVPTSITQTPDGYLLIGTVGGLFRFDGVRFSPWSDSSGIFRLNRSPDGQGRKLVDRGQPNFRSTLSPPLVQGSRVHLLRGVANCSAHGRRRPIRAACSNIEESCGMNGVGSKGEATDAPARHQ